MRLVYADYNPQTNSIDVTTFENYILRIDCNKAEDGLKTTLGSQCALNALAIDEPLEYARLALDGKCKLGWMRLIIYIYVELKAGTYPALNCYIHNQFLFAICAHSFINSQFSFRICRVSGAPVPIGAKA